MQPQHDQGGFGFNAYRREIMNVFETVMEIFFNISLILLN